MKLPRIFVSPQEMTPCGVAFSQANARYLRKVLRLRKGDRVEVFDGITACSVVLTASSRERILGQIVASEHEEPARVFVSLAFCCVRPGPVEEILRHGTELGVSVFIPVISARTNRKPQEKKDRWQTIVASACAQSGRVSVPAVEPPVSLERFLQIHFGCDTNLLLSTRLNAEPLLTVLNRQSPGRILLLVGPEGGFDPKEETEALSAGFLPVSLCRNSVRAETAALVAVGVVAAWQDSVAGKTWEGIGAKDRESCWQGIEASDEDVGLT